MTTAPDYSSLTADLNLNMNYTSAIDITTDTVNNTTTANVRTYMPKNYGVNFDLGARYENDFFEVSASIVDLGPGIHWTDGIKRIESRAFANSGVTRIYLPKSLEYIAPDAFSGCNVTAWGDYYAYARIYCAVTAASSFTFDYSDDGASAYVFRYGGSAADVVIPATTGSGIPIEGIKAEAFRGKSITSVSMPDTVTFISMYAFADCPNLKAVYMPSSLQEINSYAFQNDTSLSHVSFNEGLQLIGTHAFYYLGH